MKACSLIILRGLPGAGKTTLARLLSENGLYPVISIDDYFTDEHGQYNFVFADNHKAYQQAIDKTAEAMQAGASKIFLHNVFSLEWEMEPYFKLAAEYGYHVHIATVENWHGGVNKHEISREQLLKMAEKFKVKLLGFDE